MVKEINWESLYKDYLLGNSIQTIAIKNNMPYSYIRSNFKRRNFKIRTIKETRLNFKTQIHWQDLYLEWQSGSSFRKLAKKYNYSHTFIMRQFDRLFNTNILKPLPIRNKYKAHKIICEKLKLSKIPVGYEVHHIDENPLNNKEDNLKLLTKQEHLLIHRRTKKWYA